MSYESQMLQEFNMPSKKEVELELLKSLFYNNGAIKEFGVGERIVEEIANKFDLKTAQRNAYLETIYKKGNRIKKSNLWHRLLFRAADSLANEKLVSRPSKTILLTDKSEWMLTEQGYDKVLKILKIPIETKEELPIKSYEVQKIVKKIIEKEKPIEYNPIEQSKKLIKVTRESKIRNRGFRQAVIDAYSSKCAVCGLKLNSPDNLHWEVEAAHIVPHSFYGKDDIWNGLALCRLHHWAFDVGWFSIEDNYNIIASDKLQYLEKDYGKLADFNFVEHLKRDNIILGKVQDFFYFVTIDLGDENRAQA